jgi:hypothetical protein
VILLISASWVVRITGMSHSSSLFAIILIQPSITIYKTEEEKQSPLYLVIVLSLCSSFLMFQGSSFCHFFMLTELSLFII